ncbi:hypothetical protein [Brevundimonas viscosa]|uniref:Uncharacterized protein n=1 Tax=Brevundimonas viscosa TaxID=871741 RepID=A0A1I6TE45_9CAUL|nr:hypothetical protein [Brevundimonas viscosa]SFS87479.1 hypothetical protein SAMN05192570_3173 [Brevundimonas viscosa]
MTTKIDLRDVFIEHVATLRDESTGKASKLDLFVFFVLPVIIGGGLMIYSENGFDSTSVGIWIGALSIMAGLMVNVLVLLYAVKAVGPGEAEVEKQITLIKQVNANLLFAVLISITAIVLLCIAPLFDDLLERLVSGVIIALLVNFTFTLLMTLKRLKVLVGLRFKDGSAG